jgi:hypothetical protein
MYTPSALDVVEFSPAKAQHKRTELRDVFFFFGIYSFHSVDMEGLSVFQFLEAATPSFHLICKKKKDPGVFAATL